MAETYFAGEPGAYATNFSGPSSLNIAEGMYAYAGLRQQGFEQGSQLDLVILKPLFSAIFLIVDAEQPPQRIFLGTESMPLLRKVYEARLAEWEKWEWLSNSAQGTSVKLNITL